MTLSIELVPTELVVDPGGSVAAEVTVRATGLKASVEARVQVSGPAAAWAWVVPPEVTVQAGGSAVVRIGFRLPRGSHPPAGELPFQVRAGAGADDDSVTVDGVCG
ncbi:MAG: hypothetical protein ABIW46_01745 [Acidimicrobiales bacterium]